MRKKILLIATGGTIACCRSDAGLTPVLSSQELIRYVPDSREFCEVTGIQAFNLDSTNMEPVHWQIIAGLIQKHYQEYDGFVICHGTDTMAYTAAALSYMIQNSPKPIVITGAQKPIDMEITDAKTNLADSLRFASCPRAHGVIIESFGVGGLPSYQSGDFRQSISHWVQLGKTVVMTTQVTNEGSNMSVYEVGKNVKKEFDLLEAYDMTLEASVTKLMWILGQTKAPEEIRRLFYQTVNHDILWHS